MSVSLSNELHHQTISVLNDVIDNDVTDNDVIDSYLQVA